jgi:hypothetical protein
MLQVVNVTLECTQILGATTPDLYRVLKEVADPEDIGVWDVFGPGVAIVEEAGLVGVPVDFVMGAFTSEEMGAHATIGIKLWF